MPKIPRENDSNEETEESLRSRTDARKERLDSESGLMELALALVALTDALLARVAPPENVADAVEQARRMRPGPARNRALRLVRSALRAGDAAAIRERLDSVHGPGVSEARRRNRQRGRRSF